MDSEDADTKYAALLEDLNILKQEGTAETRIFRLILFLYDGCLLQNQPENVLGDFCYKKILHILPTDENNMQTTDRLVPRL